MIAPNDSAILYSPYTWEVTAGRAKTINAGAYFRLVLEGAPASVVLTFDLAGVAAPVPRITYDIDGVATTVDLAASIPVQLPAENTWAKHLLTVTVEATSETVDRWTTQASAVKFTGLTTTATAAAPAARPRRALFLGDSITEGVRTLNMTAAADTGRNSSRRTWAAHLAALLDAEAGQVGFGGTGVSKGGSGNAPKLSGFWNTQWAAGPSRGVAGAPPDYVIINMGTNDPTATDITAEYKQVLDAILAVAPTTVIYCLLPFKGSHAAHIQAAAAPDPARCVYVDTAGWWSTADAADSLHPYGYVAPALARRAAAIIKPPAATAVAGFFFDLSNNPVAMAAGA